MLGFQCSTTVTQPILGRPIFPTSGPGPAVAFHAPRPQPPPMSLSPSLIDYFPLNGDGLKLNWAHAVNSRTKLAQALAGMFIYLFDNFLSLNLR